MWLRKVYGKCVILVIDVVLLLSNYTTTVTRNLLLHRISKLSLTAVFFIVFVQVVLLVLEALAEISASPAGPPRNSPSQSMSESSSPTSSEQTSAPHRQLNKYFHKFMNNVMSLFRTDRKLLEERGSFILR